MVCHSWLVGAFYDVKYFSYMMRNAFLCEMLVNRSATS